MEHETNKSSSLILGGALLLVALLSTIFVVINS